MNKAKHIILNVIAALIVAFTVLESGWAIYSTPTRTLMGIAGITAIYYLVRLGIWAFRRVWGWLPEDTVSAPTHVAGIASIIVIATILIANDGWAQQSNYSSGGYNVSTYNYTPSYSYYQGTSFGMNNNANYDYGYQNMGQLIKSIFSDPFYWAGVGAGVGHMFDRNEDPGQRTWGLGQANKFTREK